MPTDHDDADEEIEDRTEPGYFALNAPRRVDRTDLPDDLARFYARHEGVGLEAPPDRSVRIARLDQVRRLGWKDLHIMGQYDPPHAGWASFAALRIGRSDMLDEIVYVLSGPAGIPPGSIVAMGTGGIAGPAGDDPRGPGSALVIAASLDAWVARMERDGADAHGLGADPGSELAKELARLNPHSYYAR